MNINLPSLGGNAPPNANVIKPRVSDNLPLNITPQSNLPELLPPRISRHEMRIAAQQAFDLQINSLMQEGQNTIVKSNNTLQTTQILWNIQICKPLDLKPKDEEQNISPEKLSALQFKALIQPQEIPEQIWDSIPNKVFESEEIKHAEFSDWRDIRPEAKSKTFETIKNNFLDLKLLNESRVLKQIKNLEANNWSITFSEYDLFPPSLQGQFHEPQQPITINLTNTQIEQLKNFRNILMQKQIEGDKAFKECFTLGEILRSTKTIKNILEDSEYLQKNLLEPTKIQLQKATESLNPEAAIRAVLERFKTKIKTIFNTAYNTQSSALKDFEINTKDFDKTQKSFIEKTINKLTDRIVQSVEISTGRQISENYNFLIPPNQKSPLGPIINSEEKLPKEKKDLYKKFLTQLQSNSKINLASLAPIMKEMQKVFFPINEKNADENSILNETTNPYIVIRAIQDPVLEMAKCSREAFSEVFAKGSPQYNSLNMQLGFVPFETDPDKQEKLEILLNSPRFSDLGKNIYFEGINFSPALLSRIKYLYYQVGDCKPL